MPGLRIGIDVGGTFTHGVVIRPPGAVVARACVPTTHAHARGVAEGVRQVLAQLLAQVDPGEVELVAHSTTQATNALLEGDVSRVIRVVVLPPGEGWLARRALRDRALDVGGGHKVPLNTHYVRWNRADEKTGPDSMPKHDEALLPVAVVQPLAGGHELREELAAKPWRAAGHAVVLASDLTRVLGLRTRARTAVVNAAMLPVMLATADYTEQAVAEQLADVPLMVVRSDGGAMSIRELRAQPVSSLLSGPAAGASAALDLSGLSEVVFIEVGGTSTDVTLISEGRVRHRFATVGGQRLLVPALDLRTVAVGGGSMLKADGSRFGPRSAHIAGLPYLFQALTDGRSVSGIDRWRDPERGVEYTCARLSDGSQAALTLTDWWLSHYDEHDLFRQARLLGVDLPEPVREGLERAFSLAGVSSPAAALKSTVKLITDAVKELAKAHGAALRHFSLVGGGGGAPVVLDAVAEQLGLPPQLAPDHAVISAIGAALAVTCVSLSKSVADPAAGDIAALTEEVERRLKRQGAKRVSTEYEYDLHRQVLTVTGRGGRAFAQDAVPMSDDQLAMHAQSFVGEGAELAWQAPDAQLWLATAAETKRREGRRGGRGRLAIVLDRLGRSLWHGVLSEHFAAEPHEREAVLARIVEQRTKYTDGGPALPGLALICAGRFIPLDQLGSAELIGEVLRWEQLPVTEPSCFVLRA